MYYCQKCGKRSIIGDSRKRTYTEGRKKKILPKNQPQYFSDYENIISENKDDLGLKEKYLNPQIPPIIPKKRKEIKLYLKSDE